jgi:catechol 2,3-dioxygenase-like lactoylglutathione lyase family enzyme
MGIQGLSHITLIVRDLERAAKFFCEGLGGQEIYDSIEKNFSRSREKFFSLGGLWIVAMEGEPPSDQGYQHIAFRVSNEELESFRTRLSLIGVEVNDGRSRVEGEGESIYFYDFDGHLFELHSGTLQGRLDRYQ